MDTTSNSRNNRASILRRIIEPRRSYYVLDIINLIFVAVTLMFQMLIQISPIMSFVAKTPFYSLQTYLGIIGGILIVVDVFTAKRLWQGKYSILLFGICALVAVSSLRMLSYGVSENIFIFCWTTIYFAIFYSCSYRTYNEKMKKAMSVIFVVFLAIWLIACLVSFFQFFNGIGYYKVINPLSKDPSAFRQGYIDNRLFGIFGTLNHAAYISAYFFFICCIKAIKTENKTAKVLLYVSSLVLISHIVLSKSRSAIISILAGMFILGWIFIRDQYFKTGWKQIVFSIVSVILAIIVLIGGVYSSVLLRKELEGDVSNGRTTIWSDYISIHEDIGLTGLSPGNYMWHILKNHEDLYIVEDTKETYPEKYQAGIIYHPHNGFLYVYVSTGIIGALLIAAFIVLCLIRVIKKLVSGTPVSDLFVYSLVIVAIGAISAVFDTALFFQNNPHSSVFWIALGLLMKESTRKKTNELENTEN